MRDVILTHEYELNYDVRFGCLIWFDICLVALTKWTTRKTTMDW